jgi:hypothetical protein
MRGVHLHHAFISWNHSHGSETLINIAQDTLATTQELYMALGG